MNYLEHYHGGVSEEQYDHILKQNKELRLKANHYRHANWDDNKIWHDIIKDDIHIVDHFKTEGYWATEKGENSSYPWPVENSMTQAELQEFLPLLQSVQHRIRNKKLNGSFRSFMGFSLCRCCGINNGTQEYSYHGWTWPIGLEHYLKEHLVAPSASFVIFIRVLNKKM